MKGIGFGANGKRAAHQIKNLNVDWHYGWSSEIQSTALNYVPMVWGAHQIDKSIANVRRELPKTKADTLLTFNEPDLRGQADMSVDKALELWPKLEAAGLRLSSPATIKPNAPWLEEFMIKADRLGLRVDFMAMHSYGWPDADDFLRKVEALHEKYQRPVWVTEYAVADFKAKAGVANRYTRAETEKFMAETVAGMRAMPFVERFAWKTREYGDRVMGTSTLFDHRGWRTSTGKLYSSL